MDWPRQYSLDWSAVWKENATRKRGILKSSVALTNTMILTACGLDKPTLSFIRLQFIRHKFSDFHLIKYKNELQNKVFLLSKGKFSTERDSAPRHH